MADRNRFKANEALNSIALGEIGLKKLIEEASSTVTYIGLAEQGTATSASGWLIKKVDTSSDTVITWAATANFNQVWDDRASLSYS